MIQPPDESLPLTPAVYHILLALYDGAKHGYAISQEVEAVTNGSIKMGSGTLYGSIKRMLRDGLIEEVLDLADGERRYYRLTQFGRDVTNAESQRLAHLVQIAQNKHALQHPE